MGDVVVEYLLIVQNADTFCENDGAFTNLLNLDSSIDIEGGIARYKNGFTCEYAVTSGCVSAKGQRYFHVRFTAKDCKTAEQLENFSAFLRAARSVMHRTVGQPEILWDDISFHYAREIYDEIYRIENLMRKLITNFMLVTVGAGWVDESSPKEIKDVIDRSKRKESLNVLHQVDFIHLADFLLRPYSTATQDELNDLLRKAETVDDLRAAQDLLPQSNWNRYFSEIVDCGDAYLNTRWKELYELRCRVAHNAIVNKDDRDRAVKLVSELAGKVEDAIRKLPQVRVPQSEVEQIAENAATTRDERVQAVLAALDDANRRKAAREAIRSAAVRLFSASRVDDDASSAFVRTPLSDSLLDLFDEGLNRGSLHVPNLDLFKQHDDREGSKQQDGDDND